MSIQEFTTIVTRLVKPAAFVDPAPPYIIGQEVTLHATYRNYWGILLEVTEQTNRARLMIWDDVLDGGCYRVLSVDLDCVEA